MLEAVTLIVALVLVAILACVLIYVVNSTNDGLRKDFKDLKTEITADVTGFKSETAKDFSSLAAEVRAMLGSQSGYLASIDMKVQKIVETDDRAYTDIHKEILQFYRELHALSVQVSKFRVVPTAPKGSGT